MCTALAVLASGYVNVQLGVGLPGQHRAIISSYRV